MYIDKLSNLLRTSAGIGKYGLKQVNGFTVQEDVGGRSGNKMGYCWFEFDWKCIDPDACCHKQFSAIDTGE